MRALLALLALVMLGGASDPILVPEVSQHEIQVRQGFTGTELLLFGAILDPSGTRAGRDYDIVVVLKGPTEAVRLREKRKIAGMWINADSTALRSAPSFFAVASSRPIDRIVDDRTAAIYELGLSWLQLSPIGAIDPQEQARFSSGLVDLRRRWIDLYIQSDRRTTNFWALDVPIHLSGSLANPRPEPMVLSRMPSQTARGDANLRALPDALRRSFGGKAC